jgi:Leucine-rich repeat (LRR) protein
VQFTELVELDISRNGITQGGLVALAGELKGLTTIRKLNLSHNAITDNGSLDTSPIAQLLVGFTSLDSLDLSHNDVSGEMAEHLV